MRGGWTTQKRPARVEGSLLPYAVILSMFGLCVTLVVAVGSLMAAEDQSSTQQSESSRKAQVGKEKFRKTCANQFCHQPDGGGEGPTDLRNRHLTIDRTVRVIADGVPGTAMPAWKSALSAEEIEALAQFVVSLSQNLAIAREDNATKAPIGASEVVLPKPKPNPYHTYTPAAEAAVGGNASAGRSIFFDDTQGGNCASCHRFQGMGSGVGPDLTNMIRKEPAEIMDKIVHPRPSDDPKYKAIMVLTRIGERYVGILRDEDQETIRLYDTSSIPPVSRTFLKKDIVARTMLKTTIMPTDYSSRYSREELLDLVTYLKVGGPNPNLMFPHAPIRKVPKSVTLTEHPNK